MSRAWYALTVFSLIAVVPQAVAEEGRFDSGGVQIHYTVKGEGEPVVLVHGFAASGALWGMSGIVEKLAADYRVITIDCRGHGKSDKPHDSGKYGMEMVEDVVRLLDHLKIKRSHVVGYSMGGMITLKLLAKHSDRVISAVPGGCGWMDGESDRELMGRLAAALEAGTGYARVLAEEFPEVAEMTDEQMAERDRMMLSWNDGKALAAAMRGMDALFMTEAELRRNKVPTLSLVGGKDSVKADVDRMVGVMGNHRVEVIKEANHMEAGMRPEFLQHIKAFLAKHSEAKKADD